MSFSFDPHFLAGTPLFKDLPVAALEAAVRSSTWRFLPPGMVLLSPNQLNHYIFLLGNGRLAVHLQSLEDSPLDYVEAGDCVGEMSFLDQRLPSAYVVAVTPCHVMALSDALVWNLIDNTPQLARNLLHILVQRIRHNHRLILTHEQQAHLDVLTGLRNRRWLESAFERVRQRCDLARQPLSVLMADVDHFKAVNDRYGHPLGDRVLVAVGNALGTPLRPQDLLVRYGGEEFVIVLPGAGLTDAVAVAERIRAAVAARPVIDTDEVRGLSVTDEVRGLSVTVSLGVATCAPMEPLSAVLAQVDAALYRAKHEGRNRVCA